MDKNIKQMEGVLKALANKRRLTMIKFIKNKREVPVGDIVEHINLSFGSVSRHLKILEKADILDSEQRSLLVFYRLSDTTGSTARKIVDEL